MNNYTNSKLVKNLVLLRILLAPSPLSIIDTSSNFCTILSLSGFFLFEFVEYCYQDIKDLFFSTNNISNFLYHYTSFSLFLLFFIEYWFYSWFFLLDLNYYFSYFLICFRLDWKNYLSVFIVSFHEKCISNFFSYLFRNNSQYYIFILQIYKFKEWKTLIKSRGNFITLSWPKKQNKKKYCACLQVTFYRISLLHLKNKWPYPPMT